VVPALVLAAGRVIPQRASLVLAVALPIACGGGDTVTMRDGGPFKEGPPVEGSVYNLLPSATLTDWVSWVEQLSVVTVVREEALPPDPEEAKRREGYLGRRVILEVDRTVWSNDGVAPASGRLEMTVNGWVLKGDVMHPFEPGGARFLPGGRYVVPLLRLAGHWAPLSGQSSFALAGDPIATADVQRRGISATAERLSRMTFDEMAAALATAPRDPRVEAHRALPPLERFNALKAERQRPGDAGAGPP
jgi:hypothetical protein